MSERNERKRARHVAEQQTEAAIDAAKALLDCVEIQNDRPWVSARDVAVLTLLWGCGLRISEALGLKGRDAPLPETLRILGKGGKERVVPVLAQRQVLLGVHLVQLVIHHRRPQPQRRLYHTHVVTHISNTRVVVFAGCVGAL